MCGLHQCVQHNQLPSQKTVNFDFNSSEDESDTTVIVANAASSLANLGQLRKLVDRLPADDSKTWFIDNVDGLRACIGFVQARQEYASLGPDSCTQMERDKNGVKLEQLLVANRQRSKILKKLESIPPSVPVNATFPDLPLQDFLCAELLQQWGKDNVLPDVLKAKTDDICSGIQKLLSELDDITHGNHKGGKWKSAIGGAASLKEALTCANAAIMWVDVNKLETVADRCRQAHPVFSRDYFCLLQGGPLSGGCFHMSYAICTKLDN